MESIFYFMECIFVNCCLGTGLLPFELISVSDFRCPWYDKELYLAFSSIVHICTSQLFILVPIILIVCTAPFVFKINSSSRVFTFQYHYLEPECLLLLSPNLSSVYLCQNSEQYSCCLCEV